MKKLLILAACCLILPAHAEFKDGNRLYGQMQKEYGSYDWFNAMGYVTGVADTISGIMACGPTGGVPAQQVYDITKQYMEENPAIRHLPADQLITRALSRVFPCKKGSGV